MASGSMRFHAARVRAVLLAAAAVAGAGCRSADVPMPVVAGVHTAAAGGAEVPERRVRRERMEEERLPPAPLHVIRSDPDDDPELTEEYYTEMEEAEAAPDAEPPARPDLATLPAGRSFSIGPPNAGWLLRGQALPARGPHHRVLPGTLSREWQYGTDRLVRLLLEAARAVEEAHPGSVLRVGNLSRAEGGKITPSVSHQSGRDADIGIFCTDLDDNAVDPPGFPKFDGQRGPLVDTTGRYLFDVARNWSFVEALLAARGARMQWIFLDTPLAHALLDHAIRAGRDAQLIDQAEKLIVRPRDSSPHANHFHIRIYCDEGDLEYGCKDLGPEWVWVKEQRDAHRQLIEERVDRILRGEEALDIGDGQDEPAPAAEPGTAELPDPPTDVDIKL